VLVTNFLHHFDATTNTDMLRKVHAALKPGGRIAVLEFKAFVAPRRGRLADASPPDRRS
jgi:predicted methyltransferase